jgi:phosphoserine phosphatase RsbU/P
MEKPEWLLQIESIFETLNEGVLVADDCDNILFINSCLADMTGLIASDVAGTNAADFYTPEEYAVIRRQTALTEVTGHNRFEFVVPQKDGTRLPVIISSRRVEDPDGRQFAIVTFTDISDQKLAEKQLRDANSKLEERQREIEEELTLAARVQQTLAPKPTVWGNLQIDTYFHAARSIGGDFGFVNPFDDDHIDLVVGDVSGHGISSALAANRLYTEVLLELGNHNELRDVLQGLNRFVIRNIGSSVFFFTMSAVRLHRTGKLMAYSGAGHPPAMIVKPGDEPRLLESLSMILGALPEAVTQEDDLSVALEPGDRIVLYSDGFTDVFDSNGEMLGVSGMEKFVRETAELPFVEMKQGILDRVSEWREGPPSDDMSLLLVEVL